MPWDNINIWESLIDYYCFANCCRTGIKDGLKADDILDNSPGGIGK